MELTDFLFKDSENIRMREKLGFDWSFILARLFEKDQARLLIRGVPGLLQRRQRNYGRFRLAKVRGCKLVLKEEKVLPFLREVWHQRSLQIRDNRGVSWRIRCVKGVGVEWEPAAITHIPTNDVTAKIVYG